MSSDSNVIVVTRAREREREREMSNRRKSMHEIQLPPGAVKNLSLDRLKRLRDEEGAFLEYFQSLELNDLKGVQRGKDEQIAANRQLAVENCEKQPEFTEKKELLIERAIEAAELKQEYERRFEELKSISKQEDPTILAKALQQAVKDSENDSDDLVAKFMDSEQELSADEFVEQYMGLRSRHWLRKVKSDKMADLIKSKAPKPSPRVPRPKNTSESMQPPYVAPINPAHSLPSPSHPTNPPFPNPGQSLPPYPPGPVPRMPSPHQAPYRQPFPAAAYSYRPQPRPTYPPRPPQPYGGRGYRY